MALGNHLITVRRLKKYIDDVIGKKANLPDTSKTIIGNISQINSDLTDKSQSPSYANFITETNSPYQPTTNKWVSVSARGSGDMYAQLYVAGNLVWGGVLNSNGEYSSFSPSFYIPIGMVVSWQVGGMRGATVYDAHLEVHE